MKAAVARMEVFEEVAWRNPLKQLPGKARPFLGGIEWAREPDTEVAKEAKMVLRRFYCGEREGRENDTDKLRAYLRSPNEEMFIVWGDVGIGKTWFLRYELELGDYSVETGDIQAGIIDMLQSWPEGAEESAYTQLCPILDRYFRQVCERTENALKLYRQIQLKRRQRNQDDREEELDETLKGWLLMDDGPERAQLLLRVLEGITGPPLFIVADNIDKTSDEDQAQLVKLIAPLLRSSRIRLVLPLRKTSVLLRDRFAGLHEHHFRDMTLTSLNLKEMLRLRFLASKAGIDLRTTPPIIDGGKQFTFPQLYDLIFDREVGELATDIAGTDARVVLMLAEQLLESNQLKGLINIRNPEYVLASWMLSDTGEVDPIAPFLLNLFDSEENPPSPGYSLIRYRVLEYFVEEGEARPEDAYFRRYFLRLGYSMERVKEVILTFLRSGLIFSRRGCTPESIEKLPEESIGPLVITKTGKAYWHKLLGIMWYYVTVKRATRFPINIIGEEELNEPPYKRQYVTHTKFINWLKEEENEERLRIRRWENSHGQMKVSLRQPFADARRVLWHAKEKESSQKNE
ncbi:ATP-binding protein [Candidatus Bipolaricaulota bacterium]|nr:ATP-binding protein [Candidatus Bipolaricaulota bacterium]